MWSYNYSPEAELYHFGIPGMHWGVRRYQNADGSLTSAGRKRYGYYGESGDKFRASNGVVVGRPRNAGVAAFRKIQGTRAGSAAINGTAKVNSVVFSNKKNRGTWKKAVKVVARENQAVREANKAHKDAFKENYKEVKRNSPLLSPYGSGTKKLAAKYMTNNEMSYKEAMKKAQTRKAMEKAAKLVLMGAAAYSLKDPRVRSVVSKAAVKATSKASQVGVKYGRKAYEKALDVTKAFNRMNKPSYQRNAGGGSGSQSQRYAGYNATVDAYNEAVRKMNARYKRSNSTQLAVRR